MAHRLVIDPVTRVEGHMKVEVQVEGGKVTDAWVTSNLFRGIEIILQNRDPRDAVYYTQRICGFCPGSHAVASAYALWSANPVDVPKNGQILRNMMLAADYLMDHLRHFYYLVYPDFVKLPPVAPFVPYGTADYRLPAKETARLTEWYLEGLDQQRRADTMVAVFGGKSPHLHGIFPGGASEPPTADRVERYASHAAELLKFIDTRMLPAAELFAEYYPDYFKLGRGLGRMISFGLYQKSARAEDRVFLPGIVGGGGQVRHLTLAELNDGITESVDHSWYKPRGPEKPGAGHTEPVRPKDGAYSWTKAPRWRGQAFETGPLARMWIKGEYRKGISQMDRTIARVLETRKMAELALEWVKELDPKGPWIARWEVPKTAQGVGLVDAVRGGLGHWVTIDGYKIARYQVVTPTTWNASPRDGKGQRGAIEEALLGTPVADPDHPAEIARVIHSFDPCNACAVQLITPDERVRRFVV
ncbi:MAG TPA: nickel-dependent hydrogenase large subunit [Firmicutes bacterium]|nr:nickel-dependent hydrogenase large subunit [Bacillota bacterium]